MIGQVRMTNLSHYNYLNAKIKHTRTLCLQLMKLLYQKYGESRLNMRYIKELGLLSQTLSELKPKQGALADVRANLKRKMRTEENTNIKNIYHQHIENLDEIMFGRTYQDKKLKS